MAGEQPTTITKSSQPAGTPAQVGPVPVAGASVAQRPQLHGRDTGTPRVGRAHQSTRFSYEHCGWLGSGVCSICGLLTTGPLGLWLETSRRPRVDSSRVPRTEYFYACVPCGAAVDALPPGVGAIFAEGWR
jgi:hypothetical protein